ncbi:hypothetical protein EX30DRAFT_352393 [Ascodesmis nigricans]|uniref:Uncharacterized protein n=1 Tax=Ascodesmis nigricans TaxID=341454 RepID=A0A4S2MIM6_9PEZI|nr:hypothetical protein EX30DRAFT_352393 [Ascodesmis nigricans]
MYRRDIFLFTLLSMSRFLYTSAHPSGNGRGSSSTTPPGDERSPSYRSLSPGPAREHNRASNNSAQSPRTPSRRGNGSLQPGHPQAPPPRPHRGSFTTQQTQALAATGEDGKPMAPKEQRSFLNRAALGDRYAKLFEEIVHVEGYNPALNIISDGVTSYVTRMKNQFGNTMFEWSLNQRGINQKLSQFKEAYQKVSSVFTQIKKLSPNDTGPHQYPDPLGDQLFYDVGTGLTMIYTNWIKFLVHALEYAEKNEPSLNFGNNAERAALIEAHFDTILNWESLPPCYKDEACTEKDVISYADQAFHVLNTIRDPDLGKASGESSKKKSLKTVLTGLSLGQSSKPGKGKGKAKVTAWDDLMLKLENIKAVITPYEPQR